MAVTTEATATPRAAGMDGDPAGPPRGGASRDPRPLHFHWVIPAAFVLLGFLALAIDLPTASYFDGRRGPFKQLLESAEAFGHAMGVILILLAVAVLDPVHRPMVPRIATCSLGAGLMADVVKMIVARTRPHRFDLTSTDVLATFDRWLPLWTSGHGDRSFPSAHTATAFGFALALAAYYPRGRVMFLCFAGLCGLQRIECGAHYVSDVCCGAAVGWLWAVLCLQGPWMAERFDRLEASLAGSEQPDGSRGETP